MTRSLALAALVCSAALLARAQEPSTSPSDPFASFARERSGDAARLAAAALASTDAYELLTVLCDEIGPRLSGSPNLDRAIEWSAALAAQRGLSVAKEPVMVPVWIRGHAKLELLSPSRSELPVLALGGSVATPPEGIEADVLVVEDFAELERRAKEARGRIVLFDVPMPELESYYAGYSVGATYRGRGPSEAARVGAVACLVRSVTTRSLGTPHTGATSYREELAKIPAAAISTEDSARLRRLSQRGIVPRLRLSLGCRTAPDAPSANVLIDLVGREKPEEIVLLGAHLDSWDVGTGAMDDGGGCAAILAVPKLLQDLQLVPRRTLRIVLYTNEENGLRGAKAYLEAHRSELGRHVAALETDSGAFRVTGFRMTASEAAHARLRSLAPLLAPLRVTTFGTGGGGADIGPLKEGGVPLFGIITDARRYFDVHHTHADTLDKIDREELAQHVAAIAVLAWALAECPSPLEDLRR
ncbi:MAG: M20/M25/M40 family metallo-hydrolase [Planctomycetes bacterium]|nr:M20/M25/M40 family metallo-hydrolase [Planctomycetota bacterium]